MFQVRLVLFLLRLGASYYKAWKCRNRFLCPGKSFFPSLSPNVAICHDVVATL